MSKTVEEIAKATGFSVTTVRLIINGQADKYRISARTRQIVEEYVATHGYAPAPVVRNPRPGGVGGVGIVAPDLADPSVARLMLALEALCEERDLALLACATRDDRVRESRGVTGLLACGVDGLVIAPSQAEPLAQLRSNKTRARTVLFERAYPAWPFPAVLGDDRLGGEEIGRKILEASGGDCYFLCGGAEALNMQDRVEGFVAACEEQGVAEVGGRTWRDAENSVTAGRRLMKMLIDELRTVPPAFICSSPQVLEGALLQLREQMGGVDPAVLIGVFGEHALLDFLPNRIASIRQDARAIAARIFARLTAPRDLANPAPPRELIPARLVCRGFP